MVDVTFEGVAGTLTARTNRQASAGGFQITQRYCGTTGCTRTTGQLTTVQGEFGDAVTVAIIRHGKVDRLHAARGFSVKVHAVTVRANQQGRGLATITVAQNALRVDIINLTIFDGDINRLTKPAVRKTVNTQIGLTVEIRHAVGHANAVVLNVNILTALVVGAGGKRQQQLWKAHARAPLAVLGTVRQRQFITRARATGNVRADVSAFRIRNALASYNREAMTRRASTAEWLAVRTIPVAATKTVCALRGVIKADFLTTQHVIRVVTGQNFLIPEQTERAATNGSHDIMAFIIAALVVPGAVRMRNVTNSIGHQAVIADAANGDRTHIMAITIYHARTSGSRETITTVAAATVRTPGGTVQVARANVRHRLHITTRAHTMRPGTRIITVTVNHALTAVNREAVAGRAATGERDAAGAIPVTTANARDRQTLFGIAHVRNVFAALVIAGAIHNALAGRHVKRVAAWTAATIRVASGTI